MQDRLLDVVLDEHDLVKRDASLVAGVAAGLAPLALGGLEGLGILRVKADAHHGLGRHRNDLLAPLADAPGQPLGHDDVAGGGDQEGLHSHVQEAADGAGGVVGMERGQNQVARESGLDRDLGRLVVADLPHHDHVRVLPEKGAQGRGKGQADLGLGLHLVDTGQVELHRILGGHDVGVDRVEAV